jgi:hypothetical protein
VSSPEDKKFDFEKLTLSDDLSGALEPLSNGAEAPPPQPEAPQARAEIEPPPEPIEESIQDKEPIAPAGGRAEEPSKYKSLLVKLSAASPYNVLLAITIAALLIAIIFCLVELGRYGFHISAKQARNSASISAPAEIHRHSC